MQLRVRGPAGQSVVKVDDEATTQEFVRVIAEAAGVPNPEAMSMLVGFPPAALAVPAEGTVKEMAVQSGDTVIVKAETAAVVPTTMQAPSATDVAQMSEDEQLARALALSEQEAAGGAGAGAASPAPPLASRRVCVRRVVDSDNSCLFRAVGYVMHGTRGHADRLRQTCADAVSADPARFSEAILGKPNHEYRAFLLKKESWGGAIELMILSEAYQREIAAYDIVTQRRDLYGEGNGYTERVMVVYDGIHYDALAMAARPNAPEADDTRVFRIDSGDAATYDAAARELVKTQNEARNFTDTANFNLRCLVCQKGLVGEKDAREHARQTGHANFGEY